ncbi:MAG: M42 family metallopeptidase [Phycisphaerales bacterium]
MASGLNVELLKRLCQTPGVPGREDRVRELIIKEVKGLFDEIRTDAMGNLLCKRNPRSGKGKTAGSRGGKGSASKGEATRVMLPCHMDQIGFLVRHVDDKGFVRLNAVGGFDTRTLFARPVTVCTKKGDIPGVMNPGGRPIHIATDEDRKKVPDIKEIVVDIGMDGKKAKETVAIGDMVVLDAPFTEMGNKIVSKCLDNRVACWLGIESVRALEKSGAAHSCEVHVAFTVQEEVGLRGAKTAAAAIAPHIAIGLDVSLSCDTPGVPEDEMVTKQGDGVGLHVMDSSFIADASLIDELEEVAKKKKIPHQRTILMRGGQDGAAGQQTGIGARAAGVVVGTRYIHSITEMLDKRDLAAARDLLAAWIPTVK